MLECHEVPRLRLCDTGKLQKRPFAELTIGTSIWSSRGRLRTVADGCERLRAVGQRLANTAQPPDPQSETGTLATHSGSSVFHVFFLFGYHFQKCAILKSDIPTSDII